MKTIHGLIFIAAALAAVGCGNNKDEAAPQTPDEIFAVNAANANRAEIELGVLAREHGDNQAVRDFGSLMQTEHTTALNDLKSIADRKNITLPSSLDSTHQKLRMRLMMLSGIEFDTVYINSQLRDHEKVIAEFEAESSGGEDSELVAYATNNLPHLNAHLDSAKQVRAIVMAQISAGRKPN